MAFPNEGFINPGTEKVAPDFKLYGYNNTRMWEKAATSTKTAWKKAGDNAINAITSYNTSAPWENGAAVSGWYLPCKAEMSKIAANYVVVSASVASAGGNIAQFDDAAINDDGFYWTSDSHDENHQWADNLSSTVDLENPSVIRRSSGDKYYGLFLLSVNF